MRRLNLRAVENQRERARPWLRFPGAGAGPFLATAPRLPPAANQCGSGPVVSPERQGISRRIFLWLAPPISRILRPLAISALSEGGFLYVEDIRFAY
jgi:hypothetical protein